MKQLMYLASLMILGCNSLIAQEFGMHFYKPNLYVGLDNPIKVVVENLNCDSIVVSSKDITILGSGCKYEIRSKKPVSALIEVFGIINGDTTHLGKEYLKLKYLPNPIAKLGRIINGDIHLGEFKAQKGVLAMLDGVDINVRCQVTKYKMLVMRNNQLIGVSKNIGPRFESHSITLVEKVEKGDQVYILEIFARIPGRQDELRLNSIELTIK